MNRDSELPLRGSGRSLYSLAVGAQLAMAVLVAAGCSESSDPVITVSPPPQTAPTPTPMPAPALPRVAGDFFLKAVSNQPLPVKCPYGTGEWDYDEDAGSWNVIESTFLMHADGTYSNTLTDQARSGARITFTYSNTYKRISESTFELQLGEVKTVATISGNQLIWDWGNGTTLTFQQ